MLCGYLKASTDYVINTFLILPLYIIQILIVLIYNFHTYCHMISRSFMQDSQTNCDVAYSHQGPGMEALVRESASIVRGDDLQDDLQEIFEVRRPEL